MCEISCVKIKSKPGSRARARVREWAAEINARVDEALTTRCDEEIAVESVFLDSAAGEGDFLLYYMKTESTERARAAAAQSAHPIDAYHRQFKRDTWESCRRLELLVDLNRIDS